MRWGHPLMYNINNFVFVVVASYRFRARNGDVHKYIKIYGTFVLNLRKFSSNTFFKNLSFWGP